MDLCPHIALSSRDKNNISKKMTTIRIKFIFTIFLAFTIIGCNCQSDSLGANSSSSWANLKMSPDPLSSMEFGNFLIEIYEHANNQNATTSEKKYFYSPLGLLDHKSAVSRYNMVTKQPGMRFCVEMWNEKLQNEVVKHLKEIVHQEIKSNKVRVILLKNVILTSKISTADYSLSPVWKNYDNRKTIWFSFSCNDLQVCDELANEMQSDPAQFDHLQLRYSLSSLTTHTKQTTVSIDSVTSGQMVSNLLQKFKDQNEVFLNANDTKKMLAETATNIRRETFDDNEVGSPDTEIQIYNTLKDFLITSRTTINEQSDKMWDSVFWNDENYRPDKTTKTLNEMFNKLDTDKQKEWADLFQTQDSYNSNFWANVKEVSSTVSAKSANDSDSSRRDEISIVIFAKLLQESKNHVQWDGEKFVPKPLQLSRIDLGKFRDSQSFQDLKVRVRYINAELTAPIKFAQHAELTVTEEWNNLKDQLKENKLELAMAKIVLNKMRDNLNDRTREIVDIGRMPTSCGDLRKMGHKLSGFFSVKGSKKIEMVYCDFYPNENDLQKWIGYADVKSGSVYFYVQRNSSFTKTYTPILFDLAVVNEGNAMDLKSGKFIAPLTGKYFFSFTGSAKFPSPSSPSSVKLGIFLRLNGVKFGSGWVEESNFFSNQSSPITLQSTLNLKSGDQVWVQIDHKSPEAYLYDDDYHHTHFTGFMMEEEIFASVAQNDTQN